MKKQLTIANLVTRSTTVQATRVRSSPILSRWNIRQHPTNGSTAQIGPWPPPFRFPNHTELDTQYNSSERVIGSSQRPLPTQDNTTYKHKTQTPMPREGFEPAIPATKRPQTYSLDRAATGIGGRQHRTRQKSGE
jgi:hypothetical protein